jgi:hypothetical protein
VQVGADEGPRRLARSEDQLIEDLDGEEYGDDVERPEPPAFTST